jgi:NodT family efflux transporter outer membrane factor (OMF) lipoprotein
MINTKPLKKSLIAALVRQSSTRAWGPLLATLSLALLTILFSACATVGPDFEKPSAPIEENWMDEYSPQITTEPVDQRAWWEVFDDPVLNHLIKIAGEQNLSLRVAGLRILEARARLGIAVGRQYPQAQALNGGYSYTKSSLNTPPISNFPSNVKNQIDDSTDVYNLGFDAAWELDFWGAFRRGVEATEAGLAATIAGYDNLLVMLRGEVASAYVIIRTLEKRLEFARSNVGYQRKGLVIANARFEGGVTSELDVQQARSLLYNTEALIPVLELSIRQAQHGLSILLGVPPSDLKDILTGISAIPTVPEKVAVGIPADLLRRRPDIRLAEFRAASQCALIGVAKADLFPHFSLAGSIGYSAGDGNNLFDSDSVSGFASPISFRWDIFNYGRIKNNIRAQDARFEQLLVTYQNTVLLAAKEVEDAMVGFLKSQEQAMALSHAAKAAQRAAELALIQYDEGLIDYTPVLNTQQVLVAQQDSLASSRGDIVTYLVAVYKALGGGWQIRLGEDFIPEQTVEAMESRTDWGDMLEPLELPAERKEPPTGKDVKLFHKPQW